MNHLIILKSSLFFNYITEYIFLEQSDVDQNLKIHKRTMIDDFIVLACEGLWEVVSDDDTYRLVKSCLYGKLPDGLEFSLNINCIFSQSSFISETYT